MSLISDGTQWFTLNASNDVLNVIGADNLVGWWKFDETSGANSLDSSKENNHLSIVDITSIGNTGIFDTCFYFDGVNDYVTAGNSSSLNIGDEITVSLWMNVDPTTANWGKVIYKSGGSGAWYLEKRNNLNTLHLRVDTDHASGFNQTFQSNATIFDNEWHHVCFTFNRGDYTWFIDGSLDKSGSYNHGSGFSGTSNLNIGRTANGVKGFLDDVRIYNRALTASEIIALYNQGQ